jgi:hypothetical protein
VYVHKMKPHLKKLGNRGKKMVFVGYEKGTKAYRTYDPVSKKFHVTRDVVFEQTRWDLSAEAGSELESSANSEPFTIHWETDVWMPSEYTDAWILGEGGALEPDTPQDVHGGHQEEQSPPFNQGFSVA